MINKKLRVAFSSAVRHAEPYLELLKSDERVELVGICEDAAAPEWMVRTGQEVAEKYGLSWHLSLDSLLGSEEVDLIVVCSEPTRHAQLALQVMAKGVNVLIDKPAAVTLEDAVLLESEAKKQNVVCTVVNRTHAPALRRLRSMVDAGDLGLPLHLDMEFFASGAFFSTSVEVPELVVDPRLSGGGEMMNFLGYCIDAIRYVTGLEVENIYAMSGALFSDLHSEHNVEDCAVVSIKMSYGVTSTVTVGRIPRAPGFGPTSSSLRVLGSHASAVADDDRPAALVFSKDGSVESRSFDGGAEALRAYLDHVVSVLTDGGVPEYSISDARANISVIDAAYKSVEERTPQVPL